MQPATIRRLLVFGVCLAAVCCLYLVPSTAGSPSELGSSVVDQDRPDPSPPVATASSRSAQLGLTKAATATVAASGRDDDPPAPVGVVHVVGISPERFTIDWPEVDDDVGVLGYTVWLNGFRVLTTLETRATLTWFNDSDTHVVQVRALDAAGNEGPSSPALLVTRPTPHPETSEEDGS